MAKTQSVEELFAQIEESVAALESGDQPLDEALQRYEAGLKALRQARSLLDRYAARIEELRGEAGEPKVEPS